MVTPPPSDDLPQQRKRTEKPPRSIRVALKRIVLPALRARGFEGELPHLRRITAEGTHFFSVQTNNKRGGSFVVNLGRLPPGPHTTRSGEVIAPERLTIFEALGNDAARLRAVPNTLTEVWFQYRQSPLSASLTRFRQAIGLGGPKPFVTEFERAAREVLDLLPECDQWWAGANGLPHVRSQAESERAQDEA